MQRDTPEAQYMVVALRLPLRFQVHLERMGALMNLEALLDPTIKATGTGQCKFARIVSDLPEKYRDAVLGMVIAGVSAEDISYRMRAAGVPVGSTVIARHRRGVCICESVVVS